MSTPAPTPPAAPPPMRPAARVSGLVKSFGAICALDGISATLPAGKILGLVGPDGAGKTTLIRLFAGLMAPTTGTVEVLGRTPQAEGGKAQAEIGYMPQRFGLYEDLSVLDNLNLYANLRALDATQRQQRFAELLRFTDLAPFTGRLAGQLSGGMKQKLGLACALLGSPRLLLLDEPGVGVDPLSRRELWRMVSELVARGVTVLWSTAYLEEAERCAYIWLLDAGRLLYDGPPRELSERVRGRVFRRRVRPGEARRIAEQELARDAVLDAVIQGASVRLVARPQRESSFQGTHYEPVEPRLEDAYVELLGGARKGESLLARGWPAQAARSASGDVPPGAAIEPAPGALVRAVGLTRRFGDFVAADHVGFEVRAGEIYGLLGPNGAGKSTTFRMLCGLLKPTEGEGRVAGIDLRHDTAGARGRLGYMAQKFSLYGDLSVGQNLSFFAGVYGLTGARKERQIRRMIDVFALGERLSMAAKELPLGFKQRLALACAVMHEPEALFLDEPTSGVDPITRREFWTHINGLVEKGVAVVVTTHFMEEAEYCDRISLIYRGRSIAIGSPDELKARVATPDNAD